MRNDGLILESTPPLPVCPTLRALLERLNGHKVWWCPNPGNAGDALIATATRDLFGRHEISFQTLRATEQAPDGATVIYGGGGNLTPDYPQAARFLAAHASRAGELILLPHTIRGHETLLASFDARTTLLCRTADSLAHARTHAPRAKVEAADDLALHLDARTFLASGRWRAARLRWTVRGHRRLRRAARRFRPDADGVFRNFRADGEASGRHAGLVEDLSHALGADVADEPRCFHASWLFLDTLARTGEIHTDRLHVAIGAALLGKQVFMYGDAHGKLRGVHEASMSGWKHVRFIENAILP